MFSRGILKCVQTQSCSTDACVDGCMAQGMDAAKQQVTDLATCYQSASCQDSACLQANCKSQLDACVAGSAPPPAGAPSGGGPAPTGTVPADWVGAWTAGNAFDLTSSKQFAFNADGTGMFGEAYDASYGGCTPSVIEKYNGTVVIDTNASTIVVYATDVEETVLSCGVPKTTKKDDKTLSFTYAPDAGSPGAQMITDADCAAKYPDDPASANLYCRYTYRKQ